jgi:large-conductance mechanosensitive channel
MTVKYKSFGDYMDKTNVISAGVAFATGLAINKCFTVFVDAFVVDVIKQTTGDGVEKLEIKINNVTINYGGTLMATINLVMILITSYIVIVASNKFIGWN